LPACLLLLAYCLALLNGTNIWRFAEKCAATKYFFKKIPQNSQKPVANKVIFPKNTSKSPIIHEMFPKMLRTALYIPTPERTKRQKIKLLKM
jgi:hypothetical protein